MSSKRPITNGRRRKPARPALSVEEIDSYTQQQQQVVAAKPTYEMSKAYFSDKVLLQHFKDAKSSIGERLALERDPEYMDTLVLPDDFYAINDFHEKFDEIETTSDGLVHYLVEAAAEGAVDDKMRCWIRSKWYALDSMVDGYNKERGTKRKAPKWSVVCLSLHTPSYSTHHADRHFHRSEVRAKINSDMLADKAAVAHAPQTPLPGRTQAGASLLIKFCSPCPS